MSPRTRVRLVVAAVAIAGAGIAGGVAALSGENGEAAEERPPLELGIAVAETPQDRALRAAELVYERGDQADALRSFEAVLGRDPDSVEAAVGAAIAAWPEGTIERLEDIVGGRPDSGVARLHLGLALFTAGEPEAARVQWREAERRDPDTPAAVRAEDLLHPEMPPGRPFFLPQGQVMAAGIDKLSPQRQLDELERRAEEGGALDWILYGSVLQRLGRPVSAREAYDRAVELEPENVQARAAAAVVRFDKDDPAKAFSRLGPLALEHPREAVVRFHLGLMLLWLQQVDEAREQLTRARELGRTTVYGREAERLLSRLEGI